MYIDFNMNQHTQDSYAETLSREERRQARNLMVSQFHEIIVRAAGDFIYWTGTKTDLIELTYEMFLAGNMRDSMGRPCSFISIVEKVCSTLHVVPPANAYSLIGKAKQRKGVKQQSFFSRYCWMLFSQKRRNPLHTMMRRVTLENLERENLHTCLH